MGKLPGFTFYTGDWLKDPELRRCSKAEKGVWIDMLAVMFECADRGVLSTGGEPWSDQEIAAAIGGDIAENLTCLRELLRKGVARRNTFGAVFSARMVRDESDRKATKSRVANLRKRTCNANVTPVVTPKYEDETEIEIDSGSSRSKAFNEQELSLVIMTECHLSGRHIQQAIESQLKCYKGEELREKSVEMIAAITKYKTTGGSKVYLWICDGKWAEAGTENISRRDRDFQEAIRRAREADEPDQGSVSKLSAGAGI